MRHRLLAVAVLSSLAVPTFAADAPAGTALHCGKLFDSRSGKLLGAHTVVVRNGKVAEVLAGRAEAVANATAIDLGDRTCMAGWTDLHVHLGSQSSPASYSEGFRLDPVDFAFRSEAMPKKPCWPASPACATSAAR